MGAKLETDHPLYRWLERHDERVVDFAERTGISFSALYSLIQGRTRNLDAAMLTRIQTGCGGEVSISEMVEWTRANARERKTA